tara:strand:- start:1572 stop:2495 length:924 start_codon:yes stop_codon:yes gene_type:complete
MEERQFIEKLNVSISQNRIDKVLYNNEYRFFRAKVFLNIINSFSKLLKYFDFKNEIIFENKIPFIKIDNMKLMICNHYYLKHVNVKITSNFSQIDKFLTHLKISPSYIIDIGACWGECSIHLSSKYKNAKIYSIEGSLKNYDIFLKNLQHNPEFNSNIDPNHLVMSDTDGFEEISNDISTMNIVRKNNLTGKIKSNNYMTVKSQSLSTFIKINKIPFIDFVKIDIEGSELNLIEDLLKADIKSIQIEIINYNSIEENINFLLKLNKRYEFHHPQSWKILSFNQIKVMVEEHLIYNPTIDIFLSKKNK